MSLRNTVRLHDGGRLAGSARLDAQSTDWASCPPGTHASCSPVGFVDVRIPIEPVLVDGFPPRLSAVRRGGVIDDTCDIYLGQGAEVEAHRSDGESGGMGKPRHRRLPHAVQRVDDLQPLGTAHRPEVIWRRKLLDIE